MHAVGTSEDRRDDEALAAVRSLGGTAPDAAVREQVAALRARWSAPDRGYHDAEHLAEVLDRLDELAAPAPAPADLVLAAWFHDAVYAGRPGRDERDSAELARSVLTGLGVPAAAADRVAELVLVTADHVPADGDDEAATLCDADLAVLASAAERYDRYVAGVVHEYRHLPGPLFRRGRRPGAAPAAGAGHRPLARRRPALPDGGGPRALDGRRGGQPRAGARGRRTRSPTARALAVMPRHVGRGCVTTRREPGDG